MSVKTKNCVHLYGDNWKLCGSLCVTFLNNMEHRVDFLQQLNFVLACALIEHMK